MQKERITDKEAICLVITFIIGSTLIIGVGGDSKNDAWISAIIGIIMVTPMLLIYARLQSLFLGKDLFDILNMVFGKVIGRIVTVIYIWYAFHLGAMVFRNYGEFINIVALPETPKIVPMLCLGLTCIYAARSGVEVLGRTATFFLPILLFILMAVQILVIPQLKLNNIKPILGNGLGPILKGGFSTFSFPFAETVLFMGISSSLKKKNSLRKVYLWGISIA